MFKFLRMSKMLVDSMDFLHTSMKLLSYISEVGGVSAPSTPANREIVSFRSCVRACVRSSAIGECYWHRGGLTLWPNPAFPFPFSAQHLFPFPFAYFENDVKILWLTFRMLFEYSFEYYFEYSFEYSWNTLPNTLSNTLWILTEYSSEYFFEYSLNALWILF